MARIKFSKDNLYENLCKITDDPEAIKAKEAVDETLEHFKYPKEQWPEVGDVLLRFVYTVMAHDKVVIDPSSRKDAKILHNLADLHDEWQKRYEEKMKGV